MEAQKKDEKGKKTNGLLINGELNKEENEELLGAILQLDNTLKKSVKDLGREQQARKRSTQKMGFSRSLTAGTGVVSPLNNKGEIVRGDKVRYIHIYNFICI